VLKVGNGFNVIPATFETTLTKSRQTAHPNEPKQQNTSNLTRNSASFRNFIEVFQSF
jgi:hypothetical protein